MILSMSLVQDSFNSSQQGDLVVLSGNMCVIFIGHLFQLGNHALNVPLDRKSIEAKLHSGPLQSLRLWIPGFWPYCGWLFHRVTMRCDVFLFMIIYIYIYLCYIYISNYVLYKWNSYCIHYVNLCSTCGCIYFTVYIYNIFFLYRFVCVCYRGGRFSTGDLNSAVSPPVSFCKDGNPEIFLRNFIAEAFRNFTMIHP